MLDIDKLMLDIDKLMLDIDKFMLSRLMVNLCETTASWREGFTKSGIKSLFIVNSRKKSAGV